MPTIKSQLKQKNNKTTTKTTKEKKKKGKKEYNKVKKNYPNENAVVLHITEEATHETNSDQQQAGQTEHFIPKL